MVLEGGREGGGGGGGCGGGVGSLLGEEYESISSTSALESCPVKSVL